MEFVQRKKNRLTKSRFFSSWTWVARIGEITLVSPFFYSTEKESFSDFNFLKNSSAAINPTPMITNSKTPSTSPRSKTAAWGVSVNDRE